MSADQPDETRTRDDRRLRELVGETRAWMKQHGIEERPLDWEAVMRRERALWWQRRLVEALRALPQRFGEAAGTLGRTLEQLAREPERAVAAALRVTLEATRGWGSLDAEALQEWLGPRAQMQFAYCSAAQRAARNLPAEQEKSLAVLHSAELPGAEVGVDAARRMVRVAFLSEAEPPVALLIPEDPELDVRFGESVGSANLPERLFQDLPEGDYLLVLCKRQSPQDDIAKVT